MTPPPFPDFPLCSPTPGSFQLESLSTELARGAYEQNSQYPKKIPHFFPSQAEHQCVNKSERDFCESLF